MLYIFHGADEFTRSEQLAKWKGKLGDPTVASLNTTLVDGRKLSLPALQQACDALPLMGKRRLVIVEDFWSRFEPPEGGKGKGKERKISAADTALVKALLEYVPRLPETTRLIFVESRSLGKENPAFAAFPTDEKRAYIQEFSLPAKGGLGRWIEQRMKTKGGAITAPAAQELAQMVGSDLRQLDQELGKLLAYANFARPVTIEDVHSLVSARHWVDVFDLVDAIGMRRGEQAMRSLHQLLDLGAGPTYLLSMIERQFRILLQVKELQGQGATISEIQRTLGIKQGFVVKKALQQVPHFAMERLEAIYNHLAQVEQAIKTGEMADVLALDLLVAELCA